MSENWEHKLGRLNTEIRIPVIDAILAYLTETEQQEDENTFQVIYRLPLPVFIQKVYFTSPATIFAMQECKAKSMCSPPWSPMKDRKPQTDLACTFTNSEPKASHIFFGAISDTNCLY